MKIIATLFNAIICLYTSLVYAAPAPETRDKANAETDANTGVREAEVDIRANQYQKCIDSTAPDMAKYDAVTFVNAQKDQCKEALGKKFLLQYPDTPAAWFITNEHGPETHRATTLESEHLRALIFEEKKCMRPLLYYSGQKDAYITVHIQIMREAQATYYAQMDSYIEGKITRGELFKKRLHSWNIYLARFKKNISNFDHALDANLKQRERLCKRQIANQQP